MLFLIPKNATTKCIKQALINLKISNKKSLFLYEKIAGVDLNPTKFLNL